jgi:single-stranded-DNA-specific exonuclease
VERRRYVGMYSPLQIGSPAAADSAPAALFQAAMASVGPGAILIAGHNDADGLAASAILARGLRLAGREAPVRLVGRGETPWSDQFDEEVRARALAGLIITDLGVRARRLGDDIPMIVIDHHVPVGHPPGGTVISGHGLNPEPSSSLLAWRCVSGLVPANHLLWLAAVGLIGDMAESGGFPEMVEARRRYGITRLRKVASLVNQPRRSAGGDAAPALALLMKCEGPEEVLSGEYPETALLVAARDEVRAELEAARRVPPKLSGDVALIRFASPAQVHPLVAQAWTGRLRGRIVLAANSGYRPGWVHFAARSSDDIDLVSFLAAHAPPGADELYGSGHRRATGGALRARDWNILVRDLGFDTSEEVPE